MNTKQKIISGLSGMALLLGGALVPINPDPITVTEWHALASMYNQVIEQSGGQLEVENFHSFKEINDKIRELGVVTEEGEALMKKVEPTTLFNKIINK